jgi:RimJ/RimL family protein N-acetyltransferase
VKAYACLTKQSFEDGDRSVRPVQPEDIESIRRWRNAQIDVLRQPRPIAPDEQERYYAEHIWPAMAEARPSNLLLGYLEKGRLIGYGGLVHIAWEHRRAEVSFLLDPARTRRDDEYRADFQRFLRLLKEVAFSVLRFNRLFTETYSTREHHIAVLEATNFRREGTLREHALVAGIAVDSLIHGCLRSDER